MFDTFDCVLASIRMRLCANCATVNDRGERRCLAVLRHETKRDG